MSTYFIPIIQAIIIFPFLALLITFPFMIINYHKYGSISKLRTLIIYSFVLYIMCAFFLVILPLPSKEYVASLKILHYQIVPCKFIVDFIRESGFQINNFSTYLKAIKDPSFYQPIFNIALTIPFGIYLRYYNKCSMIKTIILSFLLSLIFEITQLTGIYGIYSRNYRMFDVDDLFFNTMGGLIGYLICGLFNKVLPSRDSIDKKSFEMGKKVTGLRRIVAVLIDKLLLYIPFCLLIIYIIYSNIKYDFMTIVKLYLIIHYIVFVINPIIFKGRTFGKSIVKISLKKETTHVYQIFIRCNLMFISFYIIPFFCLLLMINGRILGVLLLFSYIIYMIITFIYLFINKKLWYEKFTKTENISLINQF